MKKVLITGANGFVGINLSSYLKRGNCYHLHALVRYPEKLQPDIDLFDKVHTYRDLDFIKQEGYYAIIHLAGLAHDTSSNKYQEGDYKAVNFDLTRSLVDAFFEGNGKVFIFMSTSKVYNDVLECVHEHSEIKPENPYSSYKVQSEQYVLGRLGNAVDRHYYILRPSIIHGPGNKGNLNSLFSLVNKRIPYPLGDYDNKRSFLTVDNLSFITDALLSKTPDSGVYNVADDGAISTSALVRLIGEVTDKRTLILTIPEFVINGVVGIAEFLKTPVTKKLLHKLVGSRIVANEKIKKVLDIEKLPIELHSGLINTFKSFLKIEK